MNHETDPNSHPLISETETLAERAEELSIVSMSPETFASLGSTDSKSDEAVSFMEANHLKFNTNIIVLIEGDDQLSVVSTSETDFFTRNRRATAELTARGLPDLAETDVFPLERPIQPELGHEALKLAVIPEATIPGIEDSETDESAEESLVENRETVIREFTERVGQIEVTSRNQVDNYNRQAEATLNLLFRNRQQISQELDSIERLLHQAMDGSLDLGRAFNTIGPQLDHLRVEVAKEPTDLRELADATERLGVTIDGLKNRELLQQTTAFEAVAGNQEQEALDQADGLDQSLRKLSESLDLTKPVILAAEQVSSMQITQFNHLFNLVRDDLQPRSNQGLVRPNELEELAYMIRRTNNGFGDPNNSPLIQINNSIQELRL